MANMVQPNPFTVGVPMQLVQPQHHQQLQLIEVQQQQQQQQMVTTCQQLSHITPQQNSIPVQITYNTPQVMSTQEHQQGTVTLQPVQVAVMNLPASATAPTPALQPKPPAMTLLPPALPPAAKPPAKSNKKCLRKKSTTHHPHRSGTSSSSRQKTNAAKKRKQQPDDDVIDIADLINSEPPAKPAHRPRKKLLKRPRVDGKHSKAVQTSQTKEELMMDLSLTVKSKLKEHVNTMEAEQLRDALHRIVELQPGLVFDIVVGQLAARKKEIEKKDDAMPKSVNYSEIAMKRSGKGYIIEDHLFEGDKVYKDKGLMYLKCHKVKSGCKARAKIFANKATLLHKKHNHGLPNIVELEFWNRAREEAVKEEHRKKPMSQIYEIVKVAFLAEAKDEKERKVITKKIPGFKAVESSMRMKKSQVYAAPNVSMLDMSFDALRDAILGNDEDDGGIQAVNSSNHDDANMTDNGVSSIAEIETGQGNVMDVTTGKQQSSFSLTLTAQDNDLQTITAPQVGVQLQDSVQLQVSTATQESLSMQANAARQSSVQLQNSTTLQNNIQSQASTVSEGNAQLNSGYQSNMQINANEQGSMQMSSDPPVEGNSAAVQSLLAISSQLQQLGQGTAAGLQQL